MRLIKMFGLAGVAAVAAMAFIGATSASAASTQLCTAHDALTCDSGEGATTVTMNNSGQGVWILLNELVDILCLTVEGSGGVLALANPQPVHGTISFSGCGTTSAHNNCTVLVLTQPLGNLNKTGLDTGTLTATNGEFLVNCDDILPPFGISIHCVYDFTGMSLSVGGQMLTASNTQVDKISGSLCPEVTFLDGLWNTTSNRYVLA